MLYFWPLCSNHAAICSSSGFFYVFWMIVTLFYSKMCQVMIFSLFEPIIKEKSKMLYFGSVCCKYAAVCCRVFFGSWIVVALSNYKMSQIIIFSLFDAIFNEKNNMLHFWPVCSNYAVICCSSGFFGYFG